MGTEAYRKTKPQKLTDEELENIARLDSLLINELAAWANKRLSCTHCKKCTERCEVLKESALDIGLIEEHYQKIIALDPHEQVAAVQKVTQEQPEVYHALRRCCFCGYCTAACQAHMFAADRMREWRVLFMQAGFMPPEESRLVMVDNEWHIFSAYRAIYGVAYPEYLSLKEAAEQDSCAVDTLFFPGCSFLSYAPELTRAVGTWLDSTGIQWAMSDDCCGSPLKSAGLSERAEALQQKVLDQIRAAGIKRMLTICPGCGEEFAELFGDEVEIIPLPEFLLNEGFCQQSEGKNSSEAENTLYASMTIFDSCHDRFDKRHGIAIRKLFRRNFPHLTLCEMDHSRTGTLCCGAGGAVAAYDSDISARRVWRVIDEARATSAETLVTMCPTCSYTIAQACLSVEKERGIESHHYLELLFSQTIDWEQVFSQLESMWAGEYGPWLTETFFG